MGESVRDVEKGKVRLHRFQSRSLSIKWRLASATHEAVARPH